MAMGRGIACGHKGMPEGFLVALQLWKLEFRREGDVLYRWKQECIREAGLVLRPVCPVDIESYYLLSYVPG